MAWLKTRDFLIPRRAPNGRIDRDKVTENDRILREREERFANLVAPCAQRRVNMTILPGTAHKCRQPWTVFADMGWHRYFRHGGGDLSTLAHQGF